MIGDEITTVVHFVQSYLGGEQATLHRDTGHYVAPE